MELNRFAYVSGIHLVLAQTQTFIARKRNKINTNRAFKGPSSTIFCSLEQMPTNIKKFVFLNFEKRLQF